MIDNDRSGNRDARALGGRTTGAVAAISLVFLQTTGSSVLAQDTAPSPLPQGSPQPTENPAPTQEAPASRIAGLIQQSVGQLLIQRDAVPGEQIPAEVIGSAAGEEILSVGCFIGDGDEFVTVLPFGLRDTTQLRVAMANGGTRSAVQLLAQDPQTGVALLKVTDSDAVPLKLGNSRKRVIGSPILLAEPMSIAQRRLQIGRLVGREISHGGKSFPLSQMLVTHIGGTPQAPAGSPVLSESGELVGLVHGIAAEPANSCFVLPVEAIEKLQVSYEKLGRMGPAWIGLVMDTNRSVPVVLDMRAGSPAAASGLQRGDVITSVAGRQIRSVGDMVDSCYYLVPEREVSLSVLRGVTDHTISLTPLLPPGLAGAKAVPLAEASAPSGQAPSDEVKVGPGRPGQPK